MDVVLHRDGAGECRIRNECRASIVTVQVSEIPFLGVIPELISTLKALGTVAVHQVGLEAVCF